MSQLLLYIHFEQVEQWYSFPVQIIHFQCKHRNAIL